jgi:signal transduction histidine kinase
MRPRVTTDIGTGSVEDAIRQRDELLAVASHDLRNPLGAIDLAAQMLELAHRDPASARQLQIIRRATKRMEHLLRDLTDISSMHSGRFIIEKKDEDAKALVCEIVESHEPLAREQGIVFLKDLKLEGVRVTCDRNRLAQVLSNLLGNAIKFCKQGDRISVIAEANERSLTIRIDDTGPGIPEDELPQVFEAYWTTKRRHEKKGTGLGLYIAKGIVDAHGGSIQVVSTPGLATTFTIALPR